MKTKTQEKILFVVYKETHTTMIFKIRVVKYLFITFNLGS